MIPIILLVLFGILLSFALGRKVTTVLPPLVFTLLIGIYSLAILQKAHHAFGISLIAFAAVWIFYIVHKRRILPKFSEVTAPDSPITVGFIIYILVLIVVFWCYQSHFVTNWDDFHYNATFPKDMFYFGTMPTGWENASAYKDYKPLMQLFFYWGFQGTGQFSEPLMFRYKIFLIYTALMPLFERIDIEKGLFRKVTVMTAAVVLPFAFLFEVLDSLSMDCFMAALFGYVILTAAFEKKRDWLCYYRIITALICLTLVKSIALMFSGIAIVIWIAAEIFKDPEEEIMADTFPDKKAIRKKRHEDNVRDASNPDWDRLIQAPEEVLVDRMSNNQVPTLSEVMDRVDNTLFAKPAAFISLKVKNRKLILAIGVILTAVFYLSWTIFCKIKGNTTYLSDILSDNLSSGKSIPDYAADTLMRFGRSLFSMHMNLGSNGLSLMGVVLLVGILCAVMFRTYCFGKRDFIIYLLMLAGMVMYVAFLAYAYLFIFEPWEADSLSSLDRYLGTYALVLVYVVMYHIAGKEKLVTGIMSALVVIMLLTLNWNALYGTLVPGNYMINHSEAFEEVRAVQEEVADLGVNELPVGIVLVVGNSENDLYTRMMDYDMIPLVANELNAAAYDNPAEELAGRLDSGSINYVYFTSRLVNDAGLEEFDEFSDEPLEGGHIYCYDSKNGKLFLK